jgi:hypothetical protein
LNMEHRPDSCERILVGSHSPPPPPVASSVLQFHNTFPAVMLGDHTA